MSAIAGHDDLEGRSLTGARPRRGAGAGVLALYCATIFLSAFLLFSVQPVFAKMVLPKLGGSPSVWAISMCFFQAVLLAGYCYAHALSRWLPGGLALIVHLALLASAALALPFGLPPDTEPPAGDAYLWLIGMLALGVGLPFFAISANAPLLQSWFSRSGHPHAADPYFLYGASNLGSLIALLAYPFVIEPVIGLGVQAKVWTAGFLILTGLIAISGLSTRSGAGSASTAAAVDAASARRISIADRLVWIGLSLVPSGLLVAFSSFVATDIASAPFLWVLPLALFLATFVLVFRERPVIPHRAMLVLQPVLVGATIFGLAVPASHGWYISTICGCGAFFVTTMVCHRELYERRPSPRHLTEFYLWMSFGGVLGGIAAAIVAPQIFNALYEFPLLLMLGMMCRPGLAAALANPTQRMQAILTAVASVLAIAAAGAATTSLGLSLDLRTQLVLGAILALVVGMVILRTQPAALAVLAAVIAVGVPLLPSTQNTGRSERSFFGVHRIVEAPNGEARYLMHGTTLHGVERLTHPDGQRVDHPVPASYYHPGSPMARGIDVTRTMMPVNQQRVVGIVGLGAGSMACHARDGETWRFYEIDPVVVRIAQDASLFSFMSRCLPGADIVLGDARLTLAKEPDGLFSYLVIDAFSSDAVPVHLLTREALELYVDKLAPDGLLALHISNRHLDLVGVASAVAASIPGLHAAFVHDLRVNSLDVSTSRVLIASRSAEAIDKVLRWKGAIRASAATDHVWTDDYSDILGAMWRRLR